MGNASSSSSTDARSAKSGGTLTTNLMRQRGGNVSDKYEIVKTIGEGSMGAISKAKIKEGKIGGSAYEASSNAGCGNCFGFCLPGSAREKESPVIQSERRKGDQFYALKTIVVSRVSPDFIEELRNEIDILKNLDHPNIVKAFEVFDNKLSIYIVMELCSGGDLYRRLPYSEKEAASISGKLTSAIAYMHSRNVVHRDLKFENLMFQNASDDAELKVIDFGLSKRFLPQEHHRTMTEGVGTIYTMAPQVLQGVYTSQADLWSVGVITFMLISSQKPFYHKRRRKVIDKIMRCDYKFKSVVWEQVTEDSKDFLTKLLVLDPKQRMDANQALKHKWLLEQNQLSDRKPSDEMMKKVEDNLLVYKDTSALKKVALNVIAHKSSPGEILGLRKAFDVFDTENNGVVSFEEFKMALEKSNFSEEDLQEIFKSIDVNENGHIMYTEFLAATLEVKGCIEEERIADAFDRLDSDDSGFISPENLKHILGESYSDKEIKELIDEADQDKDGQISFAEFKSIFHKQTSDKANKAGLLAQQESTLSVQSHKLLGIDAVIPGGKYDTESTPEE